MCGAEQRSSKRRQVDLSSSRSRSSRGIPLRPGYRAFGLPAPDISSQVDYMQALTYPSANMPGWCIAGLKASAWSRPFMARTRCGVRRRPRSIVKPETCAQCNSSSVGRHTAREQQAEARIGLPDRVMASPNRRALTKRSPEKPAQMRLIRKSGVQSDIAEWF